MEIIVKESVEEMSRCAARVVARTINSKPNAVLGLATGSTPLGLYKELVRMHKDEGLDFSQVTTFNLDEYVGLTHKHPQSYHYFMYENLLKHINVPKQNIYIPSGTTDNYAAFCAWYEQRIEECGGIDLQILGIGSDGHIAFNEPTSSLGSRTRIKTLARQTIEDNARFFDTPRPGADLRHHDGRGHDPRGPPDHPPGQRPEEGGGRGRRRRRPGDQHDHRQRPATSPRHGVHHRPRGGQRTENARLLRVDPGQNGQCAVT